MHCLFIDRGTDIDALYARHKAAGATIVHPIENKPWGIREYTVRDPSGYHLRFGGPLKYEPPPTTTESLPPYIRVEDNFTWWALGATIALPSDENWDLGLSAVLEERDGTKSYWALAHPSGKPDFHHPDCFIARLP